MIAPIDRRSDPAVITAIMPTPTHDNPDNAPADDRVCRGALILCGGLNPPPIAQNLRHTPLSLTCSPTERQIDRWVNGLRLCSDRPRPVWLLGAAGEHAHALGYPETVHALPDKGDFRGPAGVLRDARDQIGATGHWIMGEANRFYASADLFPQIWSAHAGSQADITLGLNPDGTFSGLFVMDVANLDSVQPIGFMDLKEQWMSSAIAAGRTIRAHRLRGWGVPVRTREDYIEAAHRVGAMPTVGHRAVMRFGDGGSPITDRPRALIHETAHIDPHALVIDAIIGRRASVEAGSVVVRSIVVDDAVVEHGTTIADTIFHANPNPSRTEGVR